MQKKPNGYNPGGCVVNIMALRSFLSMGKRRAEQTVYTKEFEAFLDAFGARVRECRKARGWTIEELAERAGLSWQYTQRVETGRHNLSVGTLYRLAFAMDLPAHELLRLKKDEDSL